MDLDWLSHTSLESGLKEAQDLTREIQRCVCDLWPTLVLWLDFLHPMHHAGTSRHERVPLQTICRMLFYLFDTTGPVEEMRSRTPRLYDMLFLIWLRFDEYQTTACTALQSFSGIAKVVRQSMWIAGKGFAEKVKGEQMADYPAMVAQNTSPHCLPAALGAVRNRPRTFYRQALRQTRHFIDITKATRPGFLGGVENHVIAVAEFASELLPLEAHAKYVVVGFVDVVHSIRSIPNLRTVAIMVCSVLHAMWRSSTDGRPLVWSIRRGIMESILKLHMEENSSQLVGLTRLVSLHSFQVNVLRALDKEEVSLRNLFAGTPQEQDILHDWMMDRIRNMKQFYRTTCANNKCLLPRRHSSVELRCPCFNACYCSKECQKADWQSHKSYCVNGTKGPRYVTVEGPELSPRDGHFVAALTRRLMSDHAQTTLVAIQRAQKRDPPVGPDFQLLLDVADTIPKITVKSLDRAEHQWGGSSGDIPICASVTFTESTTRLYIFSITMADLMNKAKQKVALGYPKEGLDFLIHLPVVTQYKYY
ncbi:hypothetical protein BD626DRAFT_404724 [Schizophyllum amplum]|uniref:MYND-type domain-containing protein n=1 Tax=Schizophyllum amplum TaxID=97359 RepID=A0A550CAW9_9AGAR|nr:hypothetical protein BD626DRAFT_404724 [Auriculariopsis ampla]